MKATEHLVGKKIYFLTSYPNEQTQTLSITFHIEDKQEVHFLISSKTRKGLKISGLAGHHVYPSILEEAIKEKTVLNVYSDANYYLKSPHPKENEIVFNLLREHAEIVLNKQPFKITTVDNSPVKYTIEIILVEEL